MIIHSSFQIPAIVSGLYRTTTLSRFETEAVEALELGFAGIKGDRHEGATRRSGGREPWYPRGTEIRNERQISLLCPKELSQIATGMGIPVLKPEWMGANLLIEGLPRLTQIPPRTCLFFEDGVTIRIDGLNVPCRLTGRAIASHYAEQKSYNLDFVRVAKRLRGLVVYVEKPGKITRGEKLEARIPEQWIYDAP